MIRINQVKVKINHNSEQLKKKAAEMLHIPSGDILDVIIRRQSIDARKKPEIFYSYTLDLRVKDEAGVLKKAQNREGQIVRVEEKKYTFPLSGQQKLKHPVVVVGMGPAGLFCAYFLAMNGYPVILLERGKMVEQRSRDVEEFWKTGLLNPESNVQFGEGGAGTFSDGKLNTLVKDKDGRNLAVLETFVKFGAKGSICYEAKPHIGTDVLINVVRNMRNEIVRLGGTVRFESKMTGLCIENNAVCGVVVNENEKIACEQVVLAIGHSARDTFYMLYDEKIPMEAKSFAVGLRVEHPQKMIDRCQYGFSDAKNPGAAPYKLAAKGRNGRSVYSFCMCPGGYVVNASSEENALAVNGMSYSGRNGKNANSAIIVAVTSEDFGSPHPLAGIEFQRNLEKKAFVLGNGKIPVQRFGDFKRAVSGALSNDCLENTLSAAASSCEDFVIEPQSKGNTEWADVSQILPKECNEAFIDGMEAFGKQIDGFDRADTILSGVESRTSSPVRILRDENMESTLHGLYPCGEGAGYAGGITSAAMDGIRVAEQIARTFHP